MTFVAAMVEAEMTLESDFLPSCSPLTTVPEKIAFFRQETDGYLRKGLSAAAMAFGPEFSGAMSALTVLLIQPDAIARRQVEQCISYVHEHGFTPILAEPLTLTVDMARQLWRFQFNAKTDGSRVIGESVYCRSPSLMLALKDTRPTGTLPASRRMTMLKGSSTPHKRKGDNLRSALGAANRIFRCVHSPDEPLDVLRETAILFDEPRLRRFYRQIAAKLRDGTPHDCQPGIGVVYEATAPHDINVDRAGQRLLAKIRRVTEGGKTDAAARLMHVIERVGQSSPELDWSEFCRDLDALAIDRYDWDSLLVASSVVEYEIPGTPKLVPSLSSPSDR
ncbi:nucleoside-diphosphate kinase [Nonomuraea sp. NPDC046802]|uniref:nucleoside-diphosphate kinase n=1 Tax=Nonomuraea sp. NPDC046802 TaxID=3154919 RepID=UPI0033FDE040